MRFASSMAKAVGAMHSNELIHKDIKLENFILTYEGDVKLTDFSYLAEIDHPFANNFLATPVYSSPEELLQLSKGLQAMPLAYNMKKKDVWCLGVAYLHLFKGYENCPEWVYNLEIKLLSHLLKIALMVHEEMKAYFQPPQTHDFWGTLIFKPEDRVDALVAAERISKS